MSWTISGNAFDLNDAANVSIVGAGGGGGKIKEFFQKWQTVKVNATKSEFKSYKRSQRNLRKIRRRLNKLSNGSKQRKIDRIKACVQDYRGEDYTKVTKLNERNATTFDFSVFIGFNSLMTKIERQSKTWKLNEKKDFRRRKHILEVDLSFIGFPTPAQLELINDTLLIQWLR
ncbi:MAG: hypothetical protein R8G66_21060 [Cytophagales bacterium]|nr:hypothetical protein [Cytophagales bacterium]